MYWRDKTAAKTSTNGVWIRNCAYTASHWRHILSAGKRVAGRYSSGGLGRHKHNGHHLAILKVWRQSKNNIPSINAYLHEEQSCQISSWYNLKWHSLWLFVGQSSPSPTTTATKTARWVAIWDQFLKRLYFSHNNRNKYIHVQTRLQKKTEAIVRAMKTSAKTHMKITSPSSVALRIFFDFPVVTSLTCFDLTETFRYTTPYTELSNNCVNKKMKHAGVTQTRFTKHNHIESRWSEYSSNRLHVEYIVSQQQSILFNFYSWKTYKNSKHNQFSPINSVYWATVLKTCAIFAQVALCHVNCTVLKQCCCLICDSFNNKATSNSTH